MYRQTFNSKRRYEKLQPLQSAFSTIHRTWRCCSRRSRRGRGRGLLKLSVVLQRTSRECTQNYNTRAQPLFCSLNLLFNDVHVAVAGVVRSRYEIFPAKTSLPINKTLVNAQLIGVKDIPAERNERHL